jgi:hypothetical protein
MRAVGQSPAPVRGISSFQTCILTPSSSRRGIFDEHKYLSPVNSTAPPIGGYNSAATLDKMPIRPRLALDAGAIKWPHFEWLASIMPACCSKHFQAACDFSAE